MPWETYEKPVKPNRPRGRPRVSDQPRARKFQVRMTALEIAIIDEARKSLGVSRSEFARRAVAFLLRKAKAESNQAAQ